MKKLLLLGDSIRLNYAPYVYRRLSDAAEVLSPEDNGRFAKYTLHELPGYLTTYGAPDVIHWNNGLWDLHHFDGAAPLTPLPEYLADLTRLARLLTATGARVLFATSTPLRPDNAEWDNAEIERYNAAATELMERLNIPVNDLHALVTGREWELLNDDKIHLNRLGIRRVGDAVVGRLAPLAV